MRFFLAAIVFAGAVQSGLAEEEKKDGVKEMVKQFAGVWDAEIEVWPEGLEKKSIKFKGVETNRVFGEYWLASDFVSEINGRKMTVHSIVGYDLDKKKWVGKVIDHGPYAAEMVGTVDEKAKTTIHWVTTAKTPDGKKMIQKTKVTQKGDGERVLVMAMKDGASGEFTKYMEIRLVKRK